MQEFFNKILCGDCIGLLNSVGQPFADLVFADPPFNIGFRYDKYHDKLEKNNYLAWTADWMAACARILKPDGSFYIAIGDEYAAHVRLIGDQLGLTLRNWIIWHYSFGQQTKQKFARSHVHIFYFVKDDKNFTFNDFAIRVPSDRQLFYNDARANGTGKIPDDTWNCYSRICNSFKERQGWHPCQMPELLLARIIAVSTTPGGLVLDPFNGSGTTAAAAFQLGRAYCGIDISDEYVKNTQLRIEDLAKQKPSDSLLPSLDSREALELKRLFVEMAIKASTLLENKHFFALFANQFAVRMNNGKQYETFVIQRAIKELSTWVV